MSTRLATRPAAPEEERREAAGAPSQTSQSAEVLRLQAAAGNHAVARLLARQPAALELEHPSPLARHPRSYADAIERATDPDAARIHRQLQQGRPDAQGRITVDFQHGCFMIEGPEAESLKPLASARKERIFSTFAAGRAPLLAAMGAAATDEARRAARAALRSYDEPRLPILRAVQTELGGRWDVEDAAARDAVLAAIQLEAATTAAGDLHGDSATVHERVRGTAGMAAHHDWCGFFTQDHYRQSNLDADLRAGFFHTNNVEDYFTYRYTRNPDRIKKWIWPGPPETAWEELRAYHARRGAARQWLNYAGVSGGGALDIRPGDIALVDVGLDGTPNHIVQVQSYDATTGRLVTMGGNDSGLVVDTRENRPAPTDAGADRERRETAEATTGEQLKAGPAGGHVGVGVHDVAATAARRGAIYGIGRPSIVDFEDHRYDGTSQAHPPAPLAP